MNTQSESLILTSRINTTENHYFTVGWEDGPYRKENTTILPMSLPKVRIIDRPCGTGKTTEILRSFKHGQRYLVVVPFISEVERVTRDAVVDFVQPTASGENETKSAHLEVLLKEGLNVVTTHKLFTDIATAANQGLLSDYDIIIDEVLDVVKLVEGKSARSFDEFYINDGYANEGKDGLITPTTKWDEEHHLVADTLDVRLYKLAKAQTLYRVNGSFFLEALPASFLCGGRSLTVYTYMAEGSLMLAYLKKMDIPFHHERYAFEDGFRSKARQLIDIRTIPALDSLSFSYTGQTIGKGQEKRNRLVSNALKNLRQRHLGNVDLSHVLITCAKQNWFKDSSGEQPAAFASGSRMFAAKWIANTTRGTNDYAYTSVCIYLYDQHINPILGRWLGLEGRDADDRYALAELIQWVYRSRVRLGQPIKLYLPSQRMRCLLERWLAERDGQMEGSSLTAAA